jgi:hypothetical protein
MGNDVATLRQEAVDHLRRERMNMNIGIKDSIIRGIPTESVTGRKKGPADVVFGSTLSS